MSRFAVRFVFISYALLFSHAVLAEQEKSQIGFEAYVTDFKVEALEKGYPTPFLDRVFSGATFRQRVVTADKNQPERKITLDTYLATRVPDWKVQQAVALYQEHKEVLAQIENKFAVQARYIVALWGNESNFGKITGNYPVISSLATMAYEGRRETFFRKQLYAALDILQQEHISQDEFLGSWAGAMGQSQFMPTSFLHYAYDFDGDGKKDIWGNPSDVFASIANFLKSEGWDNKATWGRQVKLKKGFDFSLAGLAQNKMRSLSDWQAQGVRRYDGSPLPSVDIKASLIMPDGEKGRIYLVYDNFHTLLGWNRSSYFAVAVSYLADRIKKGS
ncbi:lytic murein transglycosylase [Paraglaciecola polaris]|uniref:Membrane-bound lytic murein transglycosylase B n=1 Tax=Paraglaciecola polaris LMG 21857 TaxID=1129793 RepID=K6YFS0_9ALTE|nr:lytic murein transglycosylase [Paraglaciecola polaris]GAC31589.1 membrane-bound lytic murein transglycosylase B [Paraglaciecola polaris LMG 21857]